MKRFTSTGSSESIAAEIVSEIIESTEKRIVRKNYAIVTVPNTTNDTEIVLLNESVNSLDNSLITDDLGEPTRNTQAENLN